MASISVRSARDSCCASARTAANSARISLRRLANPLSMSLRRLANPLSMSLRRLASSWSMSLRRLDNPVPMSLRSVVISPRSAVMSAPRATSVGICANSFITASAVSGPSTSWSRLCTTRRVRSSKAILASSVVPGNSVAESSAPSSERRPRAVDRRRP